MGMVSRRSAIRHRVRPMSLRRCGHSEQQNPPVIQSAQGTTPSATPPTTSQRDAVLQLATFETVDCADWTPLRFFKVATGSESSGGRIWSLKGRSMYRHRSLPTTIPRARAGISLAVHSHRRAHRSATPSCTKPTGVPFGQ